MRGRRRTAGIMRATNWPSTESRTVANVTAVQSYGDLGETYAVRRPPDSSPVGAARSFIDIRSSGSGPRDTIQHRLRTSDGREF